ncbi:MAG: GNAT family N-acetyltransferase [Thermoanaerobaculia bacterium]
MPVQGAPCPRVRSGRSHRQRGSGSTLRALARELLESDCRYFECGARVEQLAGAALAWMEGLEGHAAGCVVQRIDASAVSLEPDRWLETIENHLVRRGASRARLYLQQRIPGLEAALLGRGYRPREEVGFLRLTAVVPTAAGAVAASIHPVEGASGWSTKLALHRQCPERPDGHESVAEEWVELEKRKTAAGYMQAFLIRVGGAVVGAVAAAPQGELLRVKNLVVHPAYRGRGVARQAVGRLWALAADSGKRALGCFALAGEASETLYRRCGFQAVTRQTEWLKNLSHRPHLSAPRSVLHLGQGAAGSQRGLP